MSSRRDAPETIPLSYLNAVEYCPRRFHYEFVQGDMLRNEFVLEGTLLHERADRPGQHATEDGIQINHLYLYSERLRLSGFADIVEEENGILIPVEYKHGKEGKWLNDHVQLCAQAMCLEERLSEHQPIPYGYIFYFGSRKRVQVYFTEELRARTLAALDLAFQVALLESPPLPLDGKIAVRCRDCSLQAMCMPEEVKLLMSKKGSSYAHTLPD
ncbi:MAG TPA: CRISPR-associated protein Cas4 [Ktedonobacteraceae bacterium]|nr:CRISPR-associated protein Cas4 [Ktedonobacteraceae bacterium]